MGEVCGATPSEDYLYSWLGELWGGRSPVVSLASLETLRSSGVLAPVESNDFQRAVGEFTRLAGILAVPQEGERRSWEEDLRPYLVAHGDALRQLQASGFIAASELQHVTPTFDSGTDGLLQDRRFQNLLLVRLRRTQQAHDVAVDLLSLLDEVEELTLTELRQE